MTDSIKTRDLINELSVIALNRAEIVTKAKQLATWPYEGEIASGDSNYPYAFGFLVSLMQSVVCDMGLSSEQLDAIQECIDYWNKK
jgi:hypothetical protein